MNFVTSYSDIEIEKWADFVYNHPNGNIFQTPEMYEVYNATKNYEPSIICCVDEEKNILGLLLSVIQKEYTGILGTLSSRSIIFGGPLIKDNNLEIYEAIIIRYNSIIKKKCIYSQIRNFTDCSEQKLMLGKHGYYFEDHLNILINLSKTEEELWKDVNTKRRNEIRRAEKEGTTVAEIMDDHSQQESYSILNEVYSRAKLPLADKSFFNNAWRFLHDKKMFEIYGAYNQNKLIGVMYLLTYRERVYDWYAGSYKDYYSKYPNDLIPWKIFLDSKKNEYTLFDFGGAGKPNVPYPVRDYKKKFGGDFVNFGRFEKVHQPILLKVAQLGFKFWKLLKKTKT